MAIAKAAHPLLPTQVIGYTPSPNRLVKGDVRAEIAQLFKNNPLFRPFIILDLYLQHMESLTEITGCQAISTRTSPLTTRTLYIKK